jgi:hypothetical protein
MRETPGQAAAGSVLADIDSTVDGLCACGCGAPLGPASGSAWFASQHCQVRWNARTVGVPDWTRGISAEEASDAIQSWASAVRAAHASPTNHVDLRIRTSPWWLGLGNNRDVLCAWLEANGVDYRNAPANNLIEVADGQVSVDVWRLYNGRPAVFTDEIVFDRLLVPLRVPIDGNLLTWDAPESDCRVLWVRAVRDPAHPTVAELTAGAVDLTEFFVPGSGRFESQPAGPRPPRWRRLLNRLTRKAQR